MILIYSIFMCAHGPLHGSNSHARKQGILKSVLLLAVHFLFYEVCNSGRKEFLNLGDFSQKICYSRYYIYYRGHYLKPATKSTFYAGRYYLFDSHLPSFRPKIKGVSSGTSLASNLLPFRTAIPIIQLH